MGKNSILKELMDLSSYWIWTVVLVQVLSVIIWKLLIHEINQNKIFSGTKFLFLIYIIIDLLEFSIYRHSLTKQPGFDFGFIISIFFPILLFYSSLIFALYFLIKSLRSGFLRLLSSMESFSLFLQCVSFIKLSQSFAYSSIAGILLSFLSISTSFMKRKIIRNQKQKKE